MHSAIAHHWQLMPNQFLSKQLHPQLTPPILLLGMTSHGIECSFGQSGSSFLVLSLHRCLCTASLLTGSSVWESEKSLILCKHCSAITTTLVCKQHCRFFFFSYIQNMALYQPPWRQLSQLKPESLAKIERDGILQGLEMHSEANSENMDPTEGKPGNPTHRFYVPPSHRHWLCEWY